MSEVTDLETHNLCTTEDAFEKFQAVSMYEEDEYITLADIVSPPRPNHDITEIIDEVPADDVVAPSLISMQNIDVPPEPCLQENVSIGNKVSEMSSSQQNDQINKPKKRGRKKKSDIDISQNQNVDNTIESRDENCKNSISHQSSDNDINCDTTLDEKSICEIPSAKKSGKRGRRRTVTKAKGKQDVDIKQQNKPIRRRQARAKQSASTNNLEPELDVNEIINESLENEKNIEPVSEETKQPLGRGKRQKKKKQYLFEGQDIEESVTELENIQTTTYEDIQYNLDTKTNDNLEKTDDIQLEQSEGFSSKVESSDDEMEDVPLVNFSKKNTMNDSAAINDTLSSPIETETKSTSESIPKLNTTLSNEKSPKKRGRPKKRHNFVPTESNLSINMDKTDMCNEPVPDIQSEAINEIDLNKVQDNCKNETDINEVPLVKKNDEFLDVLEQDNNMQNGSINKRNSKKPIMEDYEYNIDSIIISKNNDEYPPDSGDNGDLLSADSSTRRRRAKKTMHYDEGSDEDPYANVELSDDEPRRRKKGNKYYSDDEYIPGGKRHQLDLSDSEDIDEDEDFGDDVLCKTQRKKKKMEKSPRKRGKKNENTSLAEDLDSSNVDFEDCLETSLIKVDDKNLSENWGKTNEFENFLAKKIQGTDLKIKKTNEKSVIAPLQIPVIDPNEPKRTVSMCTQTQIIVNKSTGIQTESVYEIPMKNLVQLTSEQSIKACEFLTGIVKTTAELGQLMTQKSEDFISKKINTQHVKDTFKMDYCVKKSFLLFKLAKHNLMQMEEDLSKQYEEFLKTNKLIQHREQPKIMASTSKEQNSDSDCEIVEEPVPKKGAKKEKPAFNPKTVFLNKELSIKIAKKSNEEPKSKEQIKNIKGRHTVWINDSVMVKKVKPNQSFLAQDSRNKKPPDTCITLEMVSDFFKMYNRQKALNVCAPYVRTDWLKCVGEKYVCNYFINHPSEFSEGSNVQNEELVTEPAANVNVKPLPETSKNDPKTLITLCMQVLQECLCERILLQPHVQNSIKNNTEDTAILTFSDLNKNSIYVQNQCLKSCKMLSLQTICYKKITELINMPNFSELTIKTSKSCTDKRKSLCEVDKRYCDIHLRPNNNLNINKVKPLFSLCIEVIQTIQKACQTKTNSVKNKNYNPSSLKYIVFEVVRTIIYENKIHKEKPRFEVQRLTQICLKILNNNEQSEYINDMQENNLEINETLNFTIDNINTVSEDVFFDDSCNDFCEDESLSQCENLQEVESCIYEDNFSDNDNEYQENYEDDSNNWVSQVEMKELRTFVDSNSTNANENEDHPRTELSSNAIVNIKIEPEEIPENVVESSTIKIEPLDVEENNIAPLNVVTKQEYIESVSRTPEPVHRQNSASYDVDAFEAFVSTNKMMVAVSDYEQADNEIFSQSALRVRRQYEPDSDEEIDTFQDNLNLLIPQNIETAKDRLMESSSDEESSKKSNTKKQDKRRGRPKKSTKDMTTKEKHKENEVAVLTRKMREKIRQEERKNDSSDSELENMSISLRKERDNKKVKHEEKNDSAKSELVNSSLSKKEKENKKDEEIIEEKGNDLPESNIQNTSSKKDKENKKKKSLEIQLNTENASEKEIQCNDVDSTAQIADKFPDSDINKENVSFEDKEQKAEENENLSDAEDRSYSPLINEDEPVELLECEPTIPFYENLSESKKSRNKAKRTGKSDINNKQVIQVPFVERHGWECYPIDSNDSKIYQYAYIPLHKLPETFVETYFKYQDITDKTEDDEEVDRLTNLQTLNRTQSKDISHTRTKGSKVFNELVKSNASQIKHMIENIENRESGDELTPSEDEGANIDDELPPPVSQHLGENCLAKDSLMNDDSDTEKVDGDEFKTKIKEEPDVETTKTRSGRVIKFNKKGIEKAVPKDLMLTADKMMNKELAMLHAPVEIKEEIKEEVLDSKEHILKPVTRHSHKNSSKSHISPEKLKADDDSSSEEEKQWFTTKEKLLKRLEKKQECPTVDDAKRTKIVNEFIEKRSDGPEIRQRARPRPRSKKRMLERRKQMKILSRELFGDDTAHTSKKYSQAYAKGRRNIRKVLDKKSLAHSTVIANMEEFERKRRLSIRQAQLREDLGCEEGVNVVVINDELCLEYDFDQKRPVVSVHPFFTKVMKAHQYEGVKFMWDACFESLERVGEGHVGGGCILAHCMGLGKTLQVLALLHTVLTHPQVGMRRVLVCCPLSTVLNWVDEIHKWIGPVTSKIKVFELSKLKKTYERAYQLEDWYNGGGIFIIGYELFRSLSTLDPVIDCIRPTIVNKIRTALLDPGPDMIICDEGHLLKNDLSVLAVAMSRVATKRRIILTGTPMQNNLREYYCMVNFVKPNLLGTYAEYSNRFENPIMNGQHRDSREEDIKLMKARTHILHKVLEGCLQRQEASVLYPYLPKKHEYTVFISMTKCQWDLYKHYLTTFGKESKQSVLKDFHVLQKIWSHPQVLHNFLMKTRDSEKDEKIKVEKLEDDLAHEDLAASEDIKPRETDLWWVKHIEDEILYTLPSSNKFLAVFRLLDECIALGDKVLIFSTSLYTMDALEYFLRKINQWKLGQEYYRLDGSVPAEVRQKWCREFNADHNTKTKLFLISTRAGCLGLNMTAANRVIILDTSWNPAHDIQSIFRVYRFGQKKDCYIYRLVAMGTMEQKIYERSVTKQAVACRVVDEQQIDRHYNMAELSELYRLDEEGSGVSAGLAPGVTDAALLRVARHATSAGHALLHAVHEHDSLLRGSSEKSLSEHERASAWQQFQQEHAHTQMSIHNPPSIPNIKMEDIQKSEDSQGVSGKSTPTGSSTKSKRGRKKKNKPAEEQPTTSAPQRDLALDPNEEEHVIKKIMDILIQHNFHTTKQPSEIAELVNNVRNVVANAPKNGLQNTDPLTASIAKVLLHEDENKELEDSAPSNEPELIVNDYTDISYSDDNMEQPDSPEPDESSSERKKRKHRRDSDEEYVPLRTRRKTRSYPIDKPKRKSNDVVPPTPAPSAVDSEPEMIVPEKSEQPLKQSKTRSGRKKGEPKVAKPVEPITPEVPENNEVDDSIILSDDDELTVIADNLPTTSTAEQTNASVPNSDLAATEKDAASNKDSVDDSTPPPLHKSLLTNKNFIKIVAHTYLTGNPMLDEDAAILAAQYSTLKALKEVEATGKDITSGPVYDIAVKVLGSGLLEKLHSASCTKKDSPITITFDTSQMIGDANSVLKKNLKDKTINVKTELGQTAGPKPSTSRAVVDEPDISIVDLDNKPMPKKFKERKVVSRPMPLSAPLSAAPGEVVPVGMFKRVSPAASEPPPMCQEESILPDDDDDVMITPNSPSQPASTPASTAFRRNSKQLVINAVSSASKPTESSTASTAPQKIAPPTVPVAMFAASPIDIDGSSDDKKLNTKKKQNKPKVTKATPESAKKNSPPVQPSPTNETICLDSDDEDDGPLPSTKPPPLIPLPPPPSPSPRKALKSTAKPTILNKYLTKPITSQAQFGLLDNQKNVILIPATEYEKFKTSGVGAINANQIIKVVPGGKLEVQPTSENVSTSKMKSASGIIRINERGQIEVLQRPATSTATSTAAATAVATNMATPADEEYITGDPNPLPIQNLISKPQTSSVAKNPPLKQSSATKYTVSKTLTATPQIPSLNKSAISQSSSNATNVILDENEKAPARVDQSSPDPHSVLKNVVHIPADKYDSVANSTVASEAKNTTRPEVVKPITLKAIKVNKVDQLPKNMFVVRKEKDVKKDILEIKTAAAKVRKLDKVAATSLLKTLSKPLKTTNEPSNRKVIDLTDSSAPSTAASTAKSKPNIRILSKKDIITLAGTSKNIFINKAGTLHKSNTASTSSSVNLTELPAGTASTAAASTKRSSSWVETQKATKKPKVDSKKPPLTLKDFDIDDIDDIIELE